MPYSYFEWLQGYSVQYHRQQYTLHSFAQFAALYMDNHDDKYLARPGFKPGTSRLGALVETNELSEPAYARKVVEITWIPDFNVSCLRGNDVNSTLFCLLGKLVSGFS